METNLRMVKRMLKSNKMQILFISFALLLIIVQINEANASLPGFGRSDLLVVDVDENIFRSVDNGTSWNKINNSYGSTLNSVSMTINNSNDLFIANNAEDIFRSIDLGITWTLIASNINGANGDIVSIATDSNNAIYAVDLNRDVWRSADSGISWTLVNSSFNIAGSNAAAMAINKTNSIFIVDNDENVWISNNNGTSWNKINNSYGSSVNSVSMTVNSSNGLFIVNNAEDVFTSSNGGVTWTKIASNINGGSGDVVSIVVDVNDVLYGVDLADDVWISTNSGVNWTAVNTDFNGAGGNPISMITVKVDTQSPLISLNSPLDFFNSSSSSLNFSFTATDNFATSLNCSIYLDSVLNTTNTTVINGTATTFYIININDGTHLWNISCLDKNSNSNTSSSRNLTIDTIFPLIDYGASTEANNSQFDRTNIFVNVSIIEINPRNITFYLFNSTSAVNITTFYLSNLINNTKINFTNLSKATYYYNVTITDIANNINTTMTRTITLETAQSQVSNFGNSGGGSSGGGNKLDIPEKPVNNTPNSIPENKNISLVNKTEFDYAVYIHNAEKDIEDMKKAGIPSDKTIRLLEEAKIAYNQNEFNTLVSLTGQIKELRNKGFLALELINKISGKKPGVLTAFVVKDFINSDFDKAIEGANNLDNLNGIALFLETIKSTGMSILVSSYIMLLIALIIIMRKNISRINQPTNNKKLISTLIRKEHKLESELRTTKRKYKETIKQRTSQIRYIKSRIKKLKSN